MTARLLMIGLDGADGRLLDRHSAEGTLPHLAALRARGRAHRLSAPPGVTDDALWASFQYEVEVGEHGRYNYRLPLSDSRMGMAHEEEADRLAFWDDLSSHGMRVAIVDVPKCRIPRPLNGIHLVDWIAHGRYFDTPRSHPPSLAADVVQRFGPAPPSRCGYQQPILDDGEIYDIVHNLRHAVAQKRAAGLHYLASEPWDLFVLGFKEAHCASHAFWDFNISHPAHDPRHARLGDPVMSILHDIDNAVGDLITAAGPSAEVVVFSTTEYEPNGCLDHLMPGIVERLNAHLSSSPESPIERLPGESGPLLPPSDWHCAILPYNENCAALRVTRRSQSPSANAHPSAPPDPLALKEIEMQLQNLRDADTGRCVVSAISRPSSELKGSRAIALPDLLIHYASGVFPRAVVSPSLGRIEARATTLTDLLIQYVRDLFHRPLVMRPGNHAAGGFVIAAGIFAPAAIADVRTMAGFGSLAKTVLDRSPQLPKATLR